MEDHFFPSRESAKADGIARHLRVIDSHTEGEPTRLIVDAPRLRAATAAEACVELQAEHDDLRRFVVDEPRGHEGIVGAYVLPSRTPDVTGQLVFFNNVGYLGMCIHATIGVAWTLRWLGRLVDGEHRFETPVGLVRVRMDGPSIAVTSVRAYRWRAAVSVRTTAHGVVHGDVAWGGNWFFITHQRSPISETDLPTLHARAADILAHVNEAVGPTPNRRLVDHVEIVGPPTTTPEHEDADARNYVLCPGGAHDRSPCGTGTSASMACLAADGRLAPGQRWRQQGIVGTYFDGIYEPADHLDGGIIPTIAGRAFITGDATLLLEDRDPRGRA